MLDNFNRFYLAVIFLFASGQVLGKALSESLIYFRCHSQFVRERPAANDELLTMVKTGKLTAADACVELLNEGNLDRSGKLKKASLPNDRALQILRTFQAFHMTWFPNKDFVRQETEIVTSNIYDVNEMGYHLTFNLFGEDAKYSEIVTRPTSFRGVRYYTKPATRLIEPENDGAFEPLYDKKWLVFEDESKSTLWSPQWIETGKLIGLKVLNADENLVRFPVWKKKLLKRQSREYSPVSSQGAGILGTAPYLLLNLYQDANGSDGGLRMHRSWSKAVFSDLLCRSLPVLRKEDATVYVQKESRLPFRKDEACMQCHSTIDPMASTVRNVTALQPDGIERKLHSPRLITLFDVTEAPEIEVKDSDENFHLRPPQGWLRFRNYRGEMIDQKISDLSDLGEAFAKTDDLYLCAAKRYFEFMTGVDVEIGDFASPAFASAPSEALVYRNFVISLGLNLKKNQSLKKMIREIIASPFYRQSDYGNSL